MEPESWCDRCPYPGRWCKGTLFPDRCAAISGGEPGGRTTPTAVGRPDPVLAGDLVASLAHAVGADRAAKWVAEKLTGVPSCGCDARRVALNEIDRKARRLVARLARRKPAR